MSYAMTTEIVTSIPESGSIEPIKTLYTRLSIYYNREQIYKEDLYKRLDNINNIYDRIVRQHSREQKLNQLLK